MMGHNIRLKMSEVVVWKIILKLSRLTLLIWSSDRVEKKSCLNLHCVCLFCSILHGYKAQDKGQILLITQRFTLHIYVIAFFKTVSMWRF